MKRKTSGRYSSFLKPSVAIIDVMVVLLTLKYAIFGHLQEQLFVFLTVFSWFAVTSLSHFYRVYRFTKPLKIISLVFKQIILFGITIFALSGYFYELNIQPEYIFKYVFFVFIGVLFFKMAVFNLLKRYREVFNGNYRKVVIIGDNKQARALKEFFITSPGFGYKYVNTFNLNEAISLEECFSEIIENGIDEVYCSISSLTDRELYKVIGFCDNNLKTLKFIPDTKNVLFRNFKYEYYNYTPILSLRNIPLEKPVYKIIKRIFDILFSSLVIIFILSWLTPIVAVLIKIESKGPVFFKQYRNGINNNQFYCFKFRSMMPNKNANLNQATKGDMRVTKVGRFIRKTSIDELPQFFNVFFGDMSVVGPRPHMLSHTNMYAKSIDKFMVRHFVKPGITGLAQVSGFRGEIETKKDIINRVKYDIFYIENWSILVDVKIVFLTVYNAVKGEEKAY